MSCRLAYRPVRRVPCSPLTACALCSPTNRGPGKTYFFAFALLEQTKIQNRLSFLLTIAGPLC